MLLLQGVTYTHPNKDILFDDIDLIINKQDKIALIGNNGAGKSTLLKILAGNLQPSAGSVKAASKHWYVPQHFGQFNEYTISQALRVEDKLHALKEILGGTVTDENMTALDNDWAIEERCREAFMQWKLDGLDPAQQMKTLSGGQKTAVFLAGIHIHRPGIVLLDEPGNHLDVLHREILYEYIRSTTATVVVVSHDRTLLNILNTTYELSKRGITVYGGNYDFYAEQKKIERNALDQDLKTKEKALRKAKETERESLDRKQKLDARGKKKQEKAGLPTISMNTFRNNAEKSASRIKSDHAEKTHVIAQEIERLRAELAGLDKMKMGFDNSALHQGKTLITATNINFSYNDQLLWKHSLNFQIRSGGRIALKGLNGSGKSTLLKMILGELKPQSGNMDNAVIKAMYVDQDYSLIDNELSVYEQAQQFNSGILQEHEVKTRLNRFLFTKEYWGKPCKVLSGGERMRLMLCSLTIRDQAPDLILLDEPTNNLDIQNIEILTAAVNEYKGTLIVVTHDSFFLKQINMEQEIVLR
ncbi:MAG: transporter ATP-binding protein [Bacteroidetes bacterium]|jgi:ATPase subunit of ABC transporter with duplicated ATPase domains|nr:transporter ATP-binding protein [Bacteroidota bacterium]